MRYLQLAPTSKVESLKMGHTWKNVSHLEKCVTLRKVGHTCKNSLHLQLGMAKHEIVEIKYEKLKKITLKNIGDT